MALEKIREQQNLLRELMMLHGRVNLYSDFISYQAQIRKKRIEAQKEAERKREKLKETILKIILGILITSALAGVVTVLAIIAKKKGII